MNVNTEKIRVKFLLPFGEHFSLDFESHFGLRCVSRTSTPHGHSPSTGTAGGVHSCPSSSTCLRYGRTSWCPGRCSGLVGRTTAVSNALKHIQACVRVCVCFCVVLTPRGAGDASISFSQAGAVQHHPALVRFLPRLPHDVRRRCVVVVATLSCTENTEESRNLQRVSLSLCDSVRSDWKSQRMNHGRHFQEKINNCGVKRAKRRGVLTLFVWTVVKYLQWYQTQSCF